MYDLWHEARMKLLLHYRLAIAKVSLWIVVPPFVGAEPTPALPGHPIVTTAGAVIESVPTKRTPFSPPTEESTVRSDRVSYYCSDWLILSSRIRVILFPSNSGQGSGVWDAGCGRV